MSVATTASAVVIGVATVPALFAFFALFPFHGRSLPIVNVQIGGDLSSDSARRSDISLPPMWLCATFHLTGGIEHAPLSHPYLRRASRGRHRPRGPAVRLVPPHPRPWRRAVHRPARPLRPHPGGGRSRQPGFKVAETLRSEWVVRVDGKVRRRPGGTENPICRPARSRSISARSRCSGRPANCRCRCSASRNIRRKSGSSTASSTCAASTCTATSCCAGRSSTRSAGA